MTMDDWIRIAMDIKESYEEFNGFIVLHGTDTMAYTASALSFMLENLGKTVIITGSQIPLYEARSDGRDNLMNSLIIAGNYCIPEVTILFNNKLFRGNRTSKISTSSLDAFSSPNLPPLVKMGIGIHMFKVLDCGWLVTSSKPVPHKTRHFGLAIHQNDHQARRRFVEWAQNEIAVVPNFHKRILFSDEAHFWLNGYVNKQNCRIWSEADPQVYVETPLHPEKLTVWCALWAGGILLQKR
ncbi:l-asparaginase 1 [Trichonephila clavipes]|nr:l-asparaginase 1 [Trichonephila clavipes]